MLRERRSFAFSMRCIIDIALVTTRPGSTLRLSRRRAWLRKTFEYGTWGGGIRREFEPQPGDIVALEHWCSSGFANTDLDLQLKKHGIHQLIVIGLIAHTCVEATVRYAAELGYEVTVVKDATASYTAKEMHAALDINIPNYASAIVTTDEVVDAISSL
jgi:nicotinamidase-related amidase